MSAIPHRTSMGLPFGTDVSSGGEEGGVLTRKFTVRAHHVALDDFGNSPPQRMERRSIPAGPMFIPRMAAVLTSSLCNDGGVQQAWAHVKRQIETVSPQSTLIPCHGRSNLRRYLSECVQKQSTLLHICRRGQKARVRPSILAIRVVST